MISKLAYRRPSASTGESKVNHYVFILYHLLPFVFLCLPCLFPGVPWFKDRTHFSAPSLFWHVCYPWTATLFSTGHCQLANLPSACASLLVPSLITALRPPPQLGLCSHGVHPPKGSALTAGLRLGLVCLEKKGLLGCCGIRRWLYVSKRGFRDWFCVHVSAKRENINQHRKDLMRAKEKSLPLYRLLETQCWKCWRSLWRLLLDLGWFLCFPRGKALGMNRRALGVLLKASCPGFYLLMIKWQWTKHLIPRASSPHLQSG